MDEMKPGSSSGVSLPEEDEANRPWAEYDGRLYLWLLELRLISLLLLLMIIAAAMLQ